MLSLLGFWIQLTALLGHLLVIDLDSQCNLTTIAIVKLFWVICYSLIGRSMEPNNLQTTRLHHYRTRKITYRPQERTLYTSDGYTTLQCLYQK